MGSISGASDILDEALKGETRFSSINPSAIARWLREDVPFYLTAALATLLISLLYLLSKHSGSDSAWVGLPLDDNWIHLVYARSLAERGWFFYNPGVPEAGMSSPLWVVILAFVYKVFVPLGVSPQWCAKGLALLFAIGVPIVTYHLVRELKLERKWAWVAGLLVVLEPNLAYGNVAGMELPLFTLLTLLAIWLSWKQRYLLTGIILGLTVITRGEGALSAILIGAVPLVTSYARRREIVFLTEEELLLGFKLFLPPLILGGVWALFNYSVGGHFLPNTYYVKHNFALGYFDLENLKNVLMGYIAHLAFFKGLAFPVIVGLFLAAGRAFYYRKQITFSLPLVFIPLVQLYAFSVNIKVVSLDIPWTYFTRRYMDFLIPFWAILLVIGIASLWELASQWQRHTMAVAVPLASLGMLLLLGVNLAKLNHYFIEEYSWNTANIERVEVAMGQWVAENLPPDITIGATDAGTIRFWSRPDQKVIDFLGLNCHSCIGRPAEDLMNEFEPDYLVFFRQGLTDRFEYNELQNFTAERTTILGGNELVVVEVVSLPPWPPEQAEQQ